jgi:hypothetical protein
MWKSHRVGKRLVRVAFAFGPAWLLMTAIGLHANRCAAEEMNALEQPGTILQEPVQGPTPNATTGAAATGAALSSLSRNEIASTGGAAIAPWSDMPNMIGDFVNSGGYITNNTFGRLSSIPTAARYKVTDDNNTLPTDRVFCDYQHYTGAVDIANTPNDLNHFLFGAEKTFFDGAASLEVRCPLDQALSADQPGAPFAMVSGTEFGNLSLIPKVSLFRGDNWGVAGGFGLVFPTARNSNLAGTISILNQSVHLQPFIGADWEPNDRWFMMFIAGCDIDPSGNPVINAGAFAGRVFDQNLLYLDWKLGFWLYDNKSAHILNGIAPTIELHYEKTISDGTPLLPVFPTGFVGPPPFGWDDLNLTAGVHFVLGKTMLTVYGAAPLNSEFSPGTGINTGFFGEFGVQLDRRF